METSPATLKDAVPSSTREHLRWQVATRQQEDCCKTLGIKVHRVQHDTVKSLKNNKKKSPSCGLGGGQVLVGVQCGMGGGGAVEMILESQPVQGLTATINSWVSVWTAVSERTWSISYLQRIILGTSLAVQWLIIQLDMQGTWVWSLVRELRSHMPMEQLSPCIAMKNPA